MSPFLFVSFCNWVQMKQNETYFFSFEIKPIDSDLLISTEDAENVTIFIRFFL